MPAKYVLISSQNIWNTENPGPAQSFMALASNASPARRGRKPAEVSFSLAKARAKSTLQVLDSLGDSDSTLVELTDDERIALHTAYPGLRISPVADLHPLWLRRDLSMPSVAFSAAAVPVKTEITVAVTDPDGNPIRDVLVQAVLDAGQGHGAENRTNKDGVARIRFKRQIPGLEFVSAEAPGGFWAAFVPKVKILTPSTRIDITLIPIPRSTVDTGRQYFHLHGSPEAGTGVRVAVVDSGVTPSQDVTPTAGRNLVAGEDPTDFTDNGLGHGTHVAGIIAGTGVSGAALRGISPGVDLRSYRVFAKAARTAESFTIAKAIRMAVDDGCDLINLSLGVDRDVPEIYREVQRARSLGVLCVAAAGNDFREEIAFPAKYASVLAVTAVGRKGTYPKNTVPPGMESKPFSADKKTYLAAFSNLGIEADLTGAGVNIVSTHPSGLAAMSGTSMAAPAITAAIARLLAAEPTLLAAPRNQQRGDAIVALAMSAAKSLGLGPDSEGAGLLS